MNEQITYILSILTVASHIFIFVFILMLLFKKEHKYIKFISSHGILLAFSVAFGATLISLYYSEIVGFAPCVLCWYQRILMYPLAIILYVSFAKRNDNHVLPYAIALTSVGLLIASYHVYLQYFFKGTITCSFHSQVPCNQSYFDYFGYISIPTMSLTSFILILLFLIAKKIYSNKKYV